MVIKTFYLICCVAVFMSAVFMRLLILFVYMLYRYEYLNAMKLSLELLISVITVAVFNSCFHEYINIIGNTFHRN